MQNERSGGWNLYFNSFIKQSRMRACWRKIYLVSIKTSPMAADNNRFQFISLSDDIFDAIANKANEATELLEKW